MSRADGNTPPRAIRSPAFAFVAAALAARLPFALLSPSRQLSLLPDDASYYLEGARRAVETGGWPSLDGVHATNGFHPLYMAVVVALHALLHAGPERMVPLITTLHLAANAGAAWMLFRVAVPAASAGSLPLAVLLGLSAGWWAHGLAGLENALAAPLVLWLAARWRDRLAAPPDAPVPPRVWWADGAIAGLAMLARTDAAVFVALGLASLAFARAPQIGARCVAELAGVAVPAALIVAPWIAANLVRFGTIAQDSAAALQMRHAAFGGAPGSSAWLAFHGAQLVFWAHRLGAFWGPLPIAAFLLGAYAPGPRPRRSPPAWWPWIVVALALAAIAIGGETLWAIQRPARVAAALLLAAVALLAGAWWTRRPITAATALPVAYVLGLPLVYAFGLGHFQVWYATAPALAGVGLLTLPVLADLLRGRRALAAALALVVALHAGLAARDYLANGTAEGMDPDAIARGARRRARLEALVRAEPGARIGSFDCGELTYLVHPLPVVNLDGVMNHSAMVALRSHRLAEYLRDERIAVLLSPPVRIAQFQAVSPFAAAEDTALARRLEMPASRLPSAIPRSR